MPMDRTITIACVWMGDKYPRHYVERLRAMVARYFPLPFRFVCLTDHDVEIQGVEMFHTCHDDFPGWWAKMLLLTPTVRGAGDCIYFDLDTVLCAPLGPLLGAFAHDFAACANFTVRAGHPNWPCLYGSCVMTFRDGWGQEFFDKFWADQQKIMAHCGKYGDQKAFELVYPYAALLQDIMPQGFFLGRRDVEKHPHSRPEGCSVVVFAGRHTPENCGVQWIQKEWAGP